MGNDFKSALALISESLPYEIEKKLQNLGYGCVRLPKCDRLDAPVASHPDMLFCQLGDGRTLCDRGYFEENKELLEKTGIELVPSKKALQKKYPFDIAFDVLVFDGILYGNLAFIAPEILETYEKQKNVKQGYTLCSCLVTSRCVITADEGIYRSLQENGANALMISQSDINLDGYTCGFIGGASCYDFRSDTVLFFGDISSHKDGCKIKEFLLKNGHKIDEIKEMPLSDFGGAKLFIKQ